MTEGVVKVAVDKLEDMAAKELKLQTEVGKKVLELRHELDWLRTFLRDADRKRRPAAGAAADDLIEVWVRQTRELAHDAEDLLDEFVHRGELHCHGCFDLPSFLRWLRHSAAGIFARHAIFDEIKDINERIGKMKEQREKCNLEKLPCASKPHRKQYTDWSSLTELETENNMVEMDHSGEVKDLVLNTTCERTVITLTGKSGIGKTTLASYLYRRSGIRRRFDCTVWVHVPRKFRFADLLADVVCQAKASSGAGDDGDGVVDCYGRRQLQDAARRGGVEAEARLKAELAGALRGRRYLIVLDDVRSREEWAFFLAALPAGRAGSCVLVTAQFKLPEQPPVAGGGGDGGGGGHGCSCGHVRELKKLDSDRAARLFCQRMYGRKVPKNKQEQLQSLVESMTRGAALPLNVVMLAGLLRSKKEDEWEGVISSLDDTLAAGGATPSEQTPQLVPDDILPTGDGETSTTPEQVLGEQQEAKKKKKQAVPGRLLKPTSTEKILTVCMDDLPSHLKSCFLYLAGFTAQTPIDADKLLRLWVAEGFLQAKSGETTEERGAECLKELISRCLVQLVETDFAGKVTAISVHQAVLDFVQAEARDTNFFHVHSTAAGLSHGAARRIALRNTYDSDLSVVVETPKLHTLLCDIPERAAAAGSPAVWQRAMEFVHGRAPTFSVHGSRFLRVMDIKGVRLPHGETLPDEIGWLIHLRYLGVSHAAVRRLPSSITKLRNLQTLDVSHTAVDALPWRFWHIPTLRHVLAGRLAAGSAPDERDVLFDLQTLHGVPWGRWARSGGAIEKMTSLRSLMAWNVGAPAAALRSALAELECLRSLELEATHGGELPLHDLLAMLGLRQLQYLTLRGKVSKIPETTPLQGRRDHHYLLPNLARLELHGSACEQSLIYLLAALPNLADLVLEEGSYDAAAMSIPAGGFPKLNKLQLTSLDKLTKCTVAPEDDDGSKGDTLPQLHHVTVFHCKRLNRFPAKLPKLALFNVHESEELKKFMDAEAEVNEKIHVVNGKMANRRRVTTPAKERYLH
ncbi:probable disease resistance protein RXW24L [Oryza brachyantha]|uniref:probable disease resistance protein RXW24L n=1 Tax=Oryza brachyantha TaxID=4533 RepID=UPI001ADAB1E1|nr:probable disease resistance protein RXW24L [Oryza brachyantha]